MVMLCEFPIHVQVYIFSTCFKLPSFHWVYNILPSSWTKVSPLCFNLCGINGSYPGRKYSYTKKIINWKNLLFCELPVLASLVDCPYLSVDWVNCAVNEYNQFHSRQFTRKLRCADLRFEIALAIVGEEVCEHDSYPAIDCNNERLFRWHIEKCDSTWWKFYSVLQVSW